MALWISTADGDGPRHHETNGGRWNGLSLHHLSRLADDGLPLLRHIHRQRWWIRGPNPPSVAHWPRPSPCFATTCRWRLILNTSHMAPLRPSCSLDSTACRSVLTPDGPAQCPLTCQQMYTCITMFPLRQYPASRSANGLYPPPRKSSRLASGFPFAGASATGDTGRYATQISRPRPPPAPLGVFGRDAERYTVFNCYLP